MINIPNYDKHTKYKKLVDCIIIKEALNNWEYHHNRRPGISVLLQYRECAYSAFVSQHIFSIVTDSSDSTRENNTINSFIRIKLNPNKTKKYI